MAKRLRFDQIRMARRILDMKGRTAAGILGIPHVDFRKGERFDAVVPNQYVAQARQLIDLARRGRKTLGSSRLLGRPDLRAVLPFERPTCTTCRQPLHAVGTIYSGRRGKFWYFMCPRCGRRYWSSDGTANPVRPKGGNWQTLSGRVRCANCAVECSRKSCYWQCPMCQRRYRMVNGRVAPAESVRRPLAHLPFLRDRECPHCHGARLWIRARPRPPKVRHYYFRCSACRRSYKFDQKHGRLVMTKRREASVHGTSI